MQAECDELAVCGIPPCHCHIRYPVGGKLDLQRGALRTDVRLNA